MENNNILLLGVMWAVQLGLIFIQVFRFNFLFSVASFVLAWAMGNVAGVPLFFNWAGWIVGWAQILAGVLIVIFGKKNTDRRHLG